MKHLEREIQWKLWSEKGFIPNLGFYSHFGGVASPGLLQQERGREIVEMN